jgi:DNA-directed RNA polymerase subunit M/transcription elongation factor TFIIS
MQGTFKRGSFFIGAYVWIEKSVAVCPKCGYEYAKIDYKKLASDTKRKNIPEARWKKLFEAEPALDWLLEYSPKEMQVASILKERDNKPYEVECLNCGETIIYNPMTDVLSTRPT